DTPIHPPGLRQGYQWLHWRHQGMEYCAVSDVSVADLHELAQLIYQQEFLFLAGCEPGSLNVRLASKACHLLRLGRLDYFLKHTPPHPPPPPRMPLML